MNKSPADVVQTFRSAQHGRPEGLHSNNLLARVGGRAAAQNAVHSNATLTAVPGIKVGHHTLAARPTGCTVILAESGAAAGVDVRGAAPATRETDLLNPVDKSSAGRGRNWIWSIRPPA